MPPSNEPPPLMKCGVLLARKRTSSGTGMALDTATKQVIAFYVGDRSRRSAKQLWQRIPAVYREQATFYTDN